jgi:hypothetical protein
MPLHNRSINVKNKKLADKIHKRPGGGSEGLMVLSVWQGDSLHAKYLNMQRLRELAPLSLSCVAGYSNETTKKWIPRFAFMYMMMSPLSRCKTLGYASIIHNAPRFQAPLFPRCAWLHSRALGGIMPGDGARVLFQTAIRGCLSMLHRVSLQRGDIPFRKTAASGDFTKSSNFSRGEKQATGGGCVPRPLSLELPWQHAALVTVAKNFVNNSLHVHWLYCWLRHLANAPPLMASGWMS